MILKRPLHCIKLLLVLTCLLNIPVNAASCPDSGVTVSNEGASIFNSQQQIAIDNNGNAIAIWWEVNTDTNVTSIQTAMHSPGGDWSPIVTVASYISVDNPYPQIAISKVTGNAVAVWAQIQIASSDNFIMSSQLPFGAVA